LFCGQRNYSTGTRDGMRTGVYRKVRDLQPGWSDFPGASEQRSNSRQEFLKIKRFAEVVISAAIETGYPVIDAVSGGQHQHRLLYALLAKFLTYSVAVFQRYHYVEDEEIIVRN